MHICYLCNEYPPARHGGIGSFVETIAGALARRGHRVTVAGIYDARDACTGDQEGVHVFRIPRPAMRGTRFVAGCWRLRRLLRQIHRDTPIDILEGTEESFVISGAFPAVKVLRMHGSRIYIAAATGRKLSAWLRWQERRSFELADHLCAVSQYVGETTRGLLGLGDQPIEVIPNPVDTTVFRPRPEIPEEPALIVFVGTMVEYKGVGELIAAMPSVLQEIPEARLELYGGDTLDPATGESYVETLRRRIPAGAAGRIQFRGRVARSALPEILARAAVCVYPSHIESHPIAWVEGMAVGKAVVASETGPGPEVIEHGVTGLLCDPRNPASIAGALVRLLKDEPLRKRLGRAARAQAVKVYGLDELIERNLEYYRRCIEAGLH